MENLKNILNDLLSLIEKSQYKELKETLPNSWFFENGFYPMNIEINFSGDLVMKEARRKFSIPDGNGFLTNFVIQCLLESQKYQFLKPNGEIMKNSINSLLKCLDKNNLNECVYGFWTQYYDENKRCYLQNPQNFKYLVDNALNLSNENISNLFNIDIEYIPKFKKVINFISNKKNMSLSLPSDNDCTSVNIALGHLLSLYENEYEEPFNQWNSLNQSIEKPLRNIINNTYRPYSKEINYNSIDPRSYFVLRGFISDWVNIKNMEKDELMIPVTFLMNPTQQLKVYPNIQIPSLINHIELSVLSNVLFGIISATKLHGTYLITNDIINILKSIVYLFEYCIKSNLIFERTDLLFFYYPSVYSFFWFISRSYYLLKELKMNLKNEFPNIFEEISKVLSDLCENEITNKLIEKLIIVDNEEYYWEDFLGNGDYNIELNPIKNGEDRFFSTSLSINSLFDIWTVPKSDSFNFYNREFINTVDKNIINIIKKSSKYVLNNILKDENKHKLSNVFFSVPNKGPSTKITNYPSNIQINASNGKNCTPNEIETLLLNKQLITMVSGIIDENEYVKMLNEKINTTSNEWSGNFNESPFIFWSSKTFTYSISLLALSKFKLLFYNE